MKHISFAQNARPLTLAEMAQPGAVISNAWPQSRSQEGATLRAIEQVLETFPLFEAFQTIDVPYAGERRAIRARVRPALHRRVDRSGSTDRVRCRVRGATPSIFFPPVLWNAERLSLADGGR